MITIDEYVPTQCVCVWRICRAYLTCHMHSCSFNSLVREPRRSKFDLHGTQYRGYGGLQ